MWVQLNTPISSLPGEKPYEGFWLLDLGVNRLFYVTAERGDICGRGTLGIENALDPALCSGMTSGDILISRIVRSLLYALRWKQIIQQTEVMPPSLAPNASRQERREHERAEAKGKSFEKYTILSLSKNDRT